MKKLNSKSIKVILNLAKISLICAGFLITSHSNAQSSSCNRAWDSAKDASSEASSAFGSENWSRAIDLYQRATSKWEDAASECSGKNKESARNNAETSRRNVASAQNSLNREKCKPYSEPASNTFQEASQLFEAREWRRSADVYLKAEQLYQKAAQYCEGNSAATARWNAEKATSNRQKALGNIDIDARNANISAANAKKDECRSFRESFDAANTSGKSAVNDKKHKEAVEFFTSVESDFKKIEKNCKDVYSESSMTHFVKMAADAKSSKEVLLSKIKYENDCTTPGERMWIDMDELIFNADNKQKYFGTINSLEKQLKALEKNCNGSDKADYGEVRKDLALIKNDQKCFQKLRLFNLNADSINDKFKFINELKAICKSGMGGASASTIEEEFKAEENGSNTKK